MLQAVKDTLKNIRGWQTGDKLVVLAVDDYGNVRLESIQARDRLVRNGVELAGRFDCLDALETREDLACMLQILGSVTDGKGRPAVLTPYTLCANPDFDVLTTSSTKYSYEPLPTTFEKLSLRQPESYAGTWQTWQEGIDQGLLRPQFHGREHLNVELLERKLRNGDLILRLNLANWSMVALGSEPSLPGVDFTHAFGLWERSEITRHCAIIRDGLRLFESIFGFPSRTFTPPAQKLHPDLFPFVESQNVKSIDKPLHTIRRLDRNKKIRELNKLGRQPGHEHITVVRNVVFEPTSDLNFDSVGHALGQIATAFRWRKPAIISSHRVNFAGHIDPENRRFGLAKLRLLLKGIVSRWPEAQFIAADELVERMASSP